MQKHEKTTTVEVVEARDLPGRLATLIRAEAEARGVAETGCGVKFTGSLVGDPKEAMGQPEATRMSLSVEICGEFEFLKQSICFKIKLL